jgi:hypothetical protein
MSCHPRQCRSVIPEGIGGLPATTCAITSVQLLDGASATAARGDRGDRGERLTSLAWVGRGPCRAPRCAPCLHARRGAAAPVLLALAHGPSAWPPPAAWCWWPPGRPASHPRASLGPPGASAVGLASSRAAHAGDAGQRIAQGARPGRARPRAVGALPAAGTPARTPPARPSPPPRRRPGGLAPRGRPPDAAEPSCGPPRPPRSLAPLFAAWYSVPQP